MNEEINLDEVNLYPSVHYCPSCGSPDVKDVKAEEVPDELLYQCAE
jgi:hypothetical protein